MSYFAVFLCGFATWREQIRERTHFTQSREDAKARKGEFRHYTGAQVLGSEVRPSQLEIKESLAHCLGDEAKRFLELHRVAGGIPSADRVGKLTVFNIEGNKVRLVAPIHYNRRRIYVRSVLTHAEYDEQSWKE